MSKIKPKTITRQAVAFDDDPLSMFSRQAEQIDDGEEEEEADVKNIDSTEQTKLSEPINNTNENMFQNEIQTEIASPQLLHSDKGTENATEQPQIAIKPFEYENVNEEEENSEELENSYDQKVFEMEQSNEQLHSTRNEYHQKIVEKPNIEDDISDLTFVNKYLEVEDIDKDQELFGKSDYSQLQTIIERSNQKKKTIIEEKLSKLKSEEEFLESLELETIKKKLTISEASTIEGDKKGYFDEQGSQKDNIKKETPKKEIDLANLDLDDYINQLSSQSEGGLFD